MTECEMPNCQNESSDRESIWIAFTAIGATTGGDRQFRVCPDCYDKLLIANKQTTRSATRMTHSEE